jgi:hypothetical protein
MRAGPLSRTEVIDLLNHHFVPIFLSMEDYEDDGRASSEEKTELHRVFRRAGQAKLSVGTVHVYIVAPDGTPIDSRHVAEAAKGDNTLKLLRATVEKLDIARGEPLIRPVPQSAPPEHDPDALVLHLVARYAHVGGSWNEFPSENWLVLGRGEWKKLLPAGDEHSWEIEPKVADRLLVHFYPQTENNDVSTNRLDRHSLRATIVSEREGVARARLEGTLRMKHAFYPGRDDNQFVEATLRGYLDFEPATQGVRCLRLVTESATYGEHAFGVAVRSEP